MYRYTELVFGFTLKPCKSPVGKTRLSPIFFREAVDTPHNSAAKRFIVILVLSATPVTHFMLLTLCPFRPHHRPQILAVCFPCLGSAWDLYRADIKNASKYLVLWKWEGWRWTKATPGRPAFFCGLGSPPLLRWSICTSIIVGSSNNNDSRVVCNTCGSYPDIVFATELRSTFHCFRHRVENNIPLENMTPVINLELV